MVLYIKNKKRAYARFLFRFEVLTLDRARHTSKTLFEFVDTTTSVYILLFTSIEWVAS